MKQNNKFKEPVKPRKKYLSYDEQVNLQGRKAVRRTFAYALEILVKAIDADMSDYIDKVVKTRLGIAKDKLVAVNIDKGELEIQETPPSPQTEVKKEEIKNG